MVTSDDRFVTVEDAAKIKAVSEETIRRWIRNRKIKAQKAKGERGEIYLIPRSEIDSEIKDAEVVTTIDPSVAMEQFKQLLAASIESRLQPINKKFEEQNQILQQTQTIVREAQEAAAAATEETRQLRGELESHYRRLDERLTTSIPNRENEKASSTTTKIIIAIAGTIAVMSLIIALAVGLAVFLKG